MRKVRNPKKLCNTHNRLTAADVEAGLQALEECGLIRRETMPNGEVRIYLPHAPAPACHSYLILEG
ncbi:hypothetical protein [Acidithiobacillus thiooxidans]|uniref:hypothetical protein n=1 Tax=Acidithiobacillus thiooxidans TaxID=930 RepID=UPI003566F8D9